MVLALLPLQALVGSIQFVRTRRNNVSQRISERKDTPHRNLLLILFCYAHYFSLLYFSTRTQSVLCTYSYWTAFL